MQGVVNLFRQQSADALNAGEILDAGLVHSVEPSEFTEQQTPSLWSKARHVLENGSPAAFPAPLPVAGYGETMRFVTDLLNQPKRR
jgi:hypothetical protein